MKYIKSTLDLINEGQIILYNDLKEKEEKEIIISIYDFENPKHSKSVPSWGYLEYPGCKYWH